MQPRGIPASLLAVMLLLSACSDDKPADNCCEPTLLAVKTQTSDSPAGVVGDKRDILLPAPGHVYFGAFATMDEQLTEAEFEKFALDSGKRPSLHMIFRSWSDGPNGEFPLHFAKTTLKMGAIPMVTWEPWWDYSGEHYPLLKDIADGRYDEYVRHFLSQAASLDSPWFLRFAHEMEGSTYPWTSSFDSRQTPEHYIAAFRHIRQLADEISPKAIMVWSPNAGPSRAERYYPGDDVVDWIGMSLYNFPDSPQDPDHPDKLSGWIELVRKFDKPGMIGEMGCAETYSMSVNGTDPDTGKRVKIDPWVDPGMADKTVCLNRTFDVIENKYPEIRALVWFDIVKQADWRIASSESSRQSFIARIGKPRYIGVEVP